MSRTRPWSTPAPGARRAPQPRLPTEDERFTAALLSPLSLIALLPKGSVAARRELARVATRWPEVVVTDLEALRAPAARAWLAHPPLPHYVVASAGEVLLSSSQAPGHRGLDELIALGAAKRSEQA